MDIDGLVERLNLMADQGDFGRKPDPTDVRRQAATELTRLQSEVEALRDVVEDAILYLEGEISGESQRKGIVKSARSALTGAG